QMSDVWELLFNDLCLFGDDPQRFDKNSDPNHNAISNLFESVFGTDPFDRDSSTNRYTMAISGGPSIFHLSVPFTLPGKTYAVSSSQDLSSGSWTSLPPVTGTGGPLHLDVQPPVPPGQTLAPRTFFRLQV